MIPTHSTVPRWPAQPPRVDPSGRSYGVVTFGPEAAPLAEQWLAELAGLGAPVWRLSDAGGPMTGALEFCLASATTGLRLLAAGPEQQVLAVQATAHQAGLIDAELTLHATSIRERLVYCVHCKTTSSVTAGVSEVATCAGCGRRLVVYAHLSRRSGSYLGFLADAEERE